MTLKLFFSLSSSHNHLQDCSSSLHTETALLLSTDPLEFPERCRGTPKGYIGIESVTHLHMRRDLKVYSIATIGIGLLLSILFLYSSQTISEASEGRSFSSTTAIPYNQVALVLGTSKSLSSGLPNPFFTNRIKAAAELFHAGKVDYLLLSGDNSTQTYNEPHNV